jgi:hypothetical protein
MKTFKKLVRNTPLIRGLFLFILRIRVVFVHLQSQWREAVLWLWKSKEFANFTYDLSDLNKHYLAALIAQVTGKDYQQINYYISELENDEILRCHIASINESSNERYFADLSVKYGRRLGWYVIARATKPKVIIETGVDKGMGSCVLTSALLRNAEEGFPGFYFGTDINLNAGYLLSGIYSEYGKILYGDSIRSLEKFDQLIDLFINDSDHSAEYEEREYLTIEQKLSPMAYILGDNSHYTDKLLNFALATNRKFLFFQEKPVKHWYPGAGIGIAYPSVLK